MMTRLSLLFIISFALLWLPQPVFAQQQHGHEGEKLDNMPPTSVTPAGGDIIRVDVNGLVCDFCAQAINKVFRRDKAVADISVDLNEKLVVIALKKDGVMDDKKLSKMIRNSGYDVVTIRRYASESVS